MITSRYSLLRKFLHICILRAFFLFPVYGQTPAALPLMSGWNDTSMVSPSWSEYLYNDCWGYVDSAGREYAILGSLKGTFFFDVTNAYLPKLVCFQRGKDTVAIHRDYKTYSHYAYAVCDEGSSSLQIFDLQYLPDSVVKVYDDDSLSVKCHNIHISGGKLFLASNTTSSAFHAMDVLSLSDPVKPSFISTLSSTFFWHVHDVCVRNDTAFCSCGYNGIFIYDYTTPGAPVLLQSITYYPDKGYAHSSWITPDGHWLAAADENHGLGIKLFDVSDLSNISCATVFRSNLLNVPNPASASGSIPHNPFIMGSKIFTAYYHDGLEVFDMFNPHNGSGYPEYCFDTYPQNNDYTTLAYAGCWGTYPFLPSHHIIVSDITNGLFVIDGNALFSSLFDKLPAESRAYVVCQGNEQLPELFLQSMTPGKVRIEIKDCAGRLLYTGEKNLPQGDSSVPLGVSGWAPGIYFVKVSGEHFNSTTKFAAR